MNLITLVFILQCSFSVASFQIAQKYGLSSQPKLVDIIAAVPNEFKVRCLFR